jgi:hypothetical protein
MEEDTQWRTKVMLIGGALGALIGLGAAYMLVQRADREGTQVQIGTGEGIRLGMLVLGMLRQVSRLGEGKG